MSIPRAHLAILLAEADKLGCTYHGTEPNGQGMPAHVFFLEGKRLEISVCRPYPVARLRDLVGDVRRKNAVYPTPTPPHAPEHLHQSQPFMKPYQHHSFNDGLARETGVPMTLSFSDTGKAAPHPKRPTQNSRPSWPKLKLKSRAAQTPALETRPYKSEPFQGQFGHAGLRRRFRPSRRGYNFDPATSITNRHKRTTGEDYNGDIGVYGDRAEILRRRANQIF